MTVYLIHFQTNLKHARHYVGYAAHVNKRLAHHRDGTGARILAVCNERGIGYDLARIWEGRGRDFERKLKNCKHAARYCPICSGEHAREYKPTKDGDE